MRETMTTWLLASTLLMACGDDDRGGPTDAVTDGTPDSGGPAPRTDAGPPSMEDASAPPVDAARPPEGRTSTAPPEAVAAMPGTYALESTYGTIAMVPFLGDQENLTRAWGLVTIEQDGDTLRMTERGCRVVSEGSMAMIPDAVPQSIEPRVATLEFVTEGESITWIRPEVAVAIGWTPASETDALPPMADDPRVIDQDGDGQPGVTVTVSGIASGDIYVVQWQRDWYQGALGEGAGISGENHGGASEQKTIGASNMLLMQDVATRANPDTSQNLVRLIPIDAGYDCDQLLAEADSIF